MGNNLDKDNFTLVAERIAEEIYGYFDRLLIRNKFVYLFLKDLYALVQECDKILIF